MNHNDGSGGGSGKERRDLSPAARLKHLHARVPLALLRDQFRLRKRLNGVKKKNNWGVLETIEADLDASILVRERKRDFPPPAQWPDLPVAQHLDELKEKINDHQVVIVAGETGSGKTTQLPKICLALGRGDAGMIGHTQPRRLAARAVSNRIAEELHGQVGERVGYKVRFTDQVSDVSQIKVLTDGMLLAEIQQDRFLNQYDTLIIDEAHERSLNIDFLLGFLRELLPRRPDLKLIITSATIDHERFSKHFFDAPVVEVSGRTYPVDVEYRPPEKEQDLPRQLEEVLLEIQSQERKSGLPIARDVLVFFSGEREIREAHRHLRKCEFRDTEFLPLYARLSQQEQQKIFSGHKGRRVVLSTNVAETSLTVPGIRYVIDTGVARISRYSVQSKVQQLPVEAVSQASAEQRKGRAGRVMPGVCYRLYSEEDFLSRPEFTQPEIHRTNLASVILQMQNLRLGSIDDFPFIDPPDGRLVRDGYRLLSELGALDEKKKLTSAGKKLARFPLDPRLARMLLAAQEPSRDSLFEVLIIVAALAVQDPRDRPHDKQQQADQAHALFRNKESDFLSWIALWNWAEQQRQELTRNQYEKILKRHFISPVRMREWRDTHRQLLALSREQNWKLNQSAASYEAIHRSLMTGLLGNLIKRDEEGEWLSTRNRKPLIWPGSALVKTRSAWLMAAEQVETSRLFARCVATVQLDWIEKEAGHLIKRQYFEPAWSKKRGSVMAREQQSLFGLVLTAGKRVNYGSHDPGLARELMVREGLVAGLLTRTPDFVKHNQALVKKLEEFEHKLRKRDVLIDEEKQVDFYLERIPETVYSLRHLENWYTQKANQAQKKSLFMDEDFLLARTPGALDEEYPKQLDLNGVSFQLQYSFDPSGKRDGVSILVPVEMLNQLSDKRLQWLVPGLLREKMEAMIRALPKSRRRHFVPVPEYVSALMEHAQLREDSLTAFMTRELQRMTGVRVEQEEWQACELDAHLSFNIQVLESEAKENNRPVIIDEGRNLEKLQSCYSERAVKSIEQDSPEHEIVEYTAWEFPDLEAVREEKRNQVLVRVWPALKDTGKAVIVTHFHKQYEAQWEHCLGLARLAILSMSEQVRMLKKKQREWTGLQQARSLLPASRQPSGNNASSHSATTDLFDQILLAKAVDVFCLSPTVYTKAQFDSLINQGKGEFYQQALTALQDWNELFSYWHAIEKKLSKNFPLAWAHAHRDIKQQLEALFFPDFILQVSALQLKQYRRYLQAIEHRLDKISGQLGRDRSQTAELEALWKSYEQRAADLPFHVLPEPLKEYRWMLEEYRVSLFAQQLGTRMPVSAKRLRKQWEHC